MKINRAVLHILDFASCENTLSASEMDLSDKTAKNYIVRFARKALGSIDNKRGEFAGDSHFAARLRAYFGGNEDFLALSSEIAQFVARELGHMEKPVSTDVLVIDFEDEQGLAGGATREKAEQAEGTAPHDDVAPDPFSAYDREGPASRYFAVFLLESKQAYVHEMRYGDDGEFAGIARHHAVLPNPSQKLASYALVNLRTMDVSFVDRKRTIAGEEHWLIPDGLLQCSMQASSREALSTVTELVEAVAEEYGQNTAVALSRAKAYVAENAQEADELVIERMADAVFEQDPVMRERLEEAAEAVDLPQSVPLQREAAKRVASRHRIRTDTGIEVSFPAEYSRSPEYITFTSEADGTISIKLSNIAHIENR